MQASLQPPKIEFWYEFASTYSYLSAMRIDELAAANGVAVEWKPFLLGPIFQSQGWTTSPFNIYPAKGRYMVRDMQRLCAARGLAFRAPNPFPQNGLAAARIALVAAGCGCIAAFTRATYLAQFADGRDIGHPETTLAVVTALASQFGRDPAGIIRASLEPAIKDRLRTQSAEAASLGIFGAPSFRTPDGELFWGDDRLDQAIAWTKLTGVSAI